MTDRHKKSLLNAGVAFFFLYGGFSFVFQSLTWPMTCEAETRGFFCVLFLPVFLIATAVVEGV